MAINKVIILDQDGEAVELDTLTESSYLSFIDVVHHKIHEGLIFEAASATTIASPGDYVWSIVVPSGVNLHLTTHVTVDKLTHTFLYEGSTVSGGTSITPYNKYRSSATTTDTVIKHGVTVSDAGTLLVPRILGSGNTPASSIGGDYKHDNEWILKEDTTYIFKVTTISSDTIVNFVINFYTSEV